MLRRFRVVWGRNAFGSTGGAAGEAASASPYLAGQYAREALQAHGAWGNFAGGGTMSAVKGLRRAGGSAFLVLSVYQCVDSTNLVD